MNTRRYAALSLIPLVMLCAGFAALLAPPSLSGPLVVAVPGSLPVAGIIAEQLGLSLLQQPLYLADLVGLSLLALATLETWAIAISWEVRQQRSR